MYMSEILCTLCMNCNKCINDTTNKDQTTKHLTIKRSASQLTIQQPLNHLSEMDQENIEEANLVPLNTNGSTCLGLSNVILGLQQNTGHKSFAPISLK